MRIQRIHRSRSAIAAAVIALVALSAGPVAADTTPPGDATYSQKGRSAELYAGSCTENGDETITCTEVSVGMFIGKMTDNVSGVSHTSQVCASRSSYTISLITKEYVGEPVDERGCRVDLPSDAIGIDSKLESASLASTHIDLATLVCDEWECYEGAVRDAVVSASWTGFGPINSFKSRSSGVEGLCRYSDWSKASGREATASATIDGVSLGGDSAAYLASGRFGFKSSCSEA